LPVVGLQVGRSSAASARGIRAARRSRLQPDNFFFTILM
jgi:hypothetical protein